MITTSRKFHYKTSFKLKLYAILVGAIGMFVVTVYHAIFEPPDPGDWWGLFFMMILSAVFSVLIFFVALPRAHSVIVTTPSGISQVRADGSSVDINWPEIAYVTSNSHRTKIYSREYKRFILIYAEELETFDELKAILDKQTHKS